jgi:hypothetical protein
MKKQLILASLIALSGMATAQWSINAPHVYKTNPAGNVGIGTGLNPLFKLEIITNTATDDGTHITQSGAGNASMFLRNPAGSRWGIHHTGSGSPVGGGHFLIEDAGTNRVLIDNTTGYFGIGTTSPAYILDLSTNSATGGMRLYQSAGGDCKLHLDNGGSDWTLNSTSTGNLDVQYSGNTRYFVDGPNGYFGIGTNAPTARLDVRSNGLSATSAGYFDFTTSLSGGGNGITVSANDAGATNSQQNIGVDAYGNCGAGGSSTAIGLRGSAAGANKNYGGYFKSGGPSGSATMGVYSIITTNNSIINSALLGDANGMSNAGLDTWAGYFLGDIMVTGTPYSTAGGMWTMSDRRYKRDIIQLEGALEKIAKLNGYSYNFKTEEFKDKNFSNREQLGFIAQELKEVFPQMVTEGPDGFNYVNYTAMIPVLLEAIKEQKQSTDAMKADLQKQINDQKAQISELLEKTGTSTGLNNSGSVETGVTMSQNEPNPFTHETVVNYTLPSQVGSAYMAVYDLSGKQITKFALDQKGAASITISSENLAAGIYIYSIVADGKVMDSKRMIVADK